MRGLKHIFHILATLAICMQFMAHLSPVLAKIHGNWQITICAADSIRTITIDENGEEVPQPNMRMHDCAACNITQLTALTPKAFSTPVLNVQKSQYKVWHQTTAPKIALRTAHQTRAPPHQS